MNTCIMPETVIGLEIQERKTPLWNLWITEDQVFKEYLMTRRKRITVL